MPLSRLENFLVNTDGNILYVNPSDLDATDSFDNKGNSLTRPFITIQRALLEAARFAYQTGPNNDKFDRTTILLYPGEHVIDNRPGLHIKNNGGNVQYFQFDSDVTTGTNLELKNDSIFNLDNIGNILYKFNSVHGGAIVPKGTSIVGLDLRKTKIRPLYVPNPDVDDSIIPRSSLFRVTGGCYFWQFSMFDANRSVYYSKTFSEKRNPSISHHKLTCFEYADGLNPEKKTGESDLQMYYYKLMNAYGANTGNRSIISYPAPTEAENDFEPNTPEFKIVGDLTSTTGNAIQTLTSSGLVATVTTQDAHGLTKDDPVRISGITSTLYEGSYNVSGITSERTFKYVLNADANDDTVAVDQNKAKVIIESDSVTGASPYIFNCSLRSVYGMCGLHADGAKATGFKSMVVAQFTGIGLQKDDKAFVIYNETTGDYDNTVTAAAETQRPLYINQDSVYKKRYENFHIKCSNDAFIQAVSVFAIGYANHFLSESGGEQSITNSNSNFGNKALVSKGFRKDPFSRDDTGYITHIVPPKDLQLDSTNIIWRSLDPEVTLSTGTTSRLYIEGEKDITNPPTNVVNGFRIGAKQDEKLYLNVTLPNNVSATYTSPVLMQVSSGDGPTSKKEFTVDRTTEENNIVSNEITFTEPHNFITGESVRVYSDNGRTPDGIKIGKLYYVISTAATKIKLANNENDAQDNNPLTIKNKLGGTLTVISTVTDKIPGDIGHPVQFDTTKNQWYVLGSSTRTTNKIYDGFVGFSTDIIKNNSQTYVQRTPESRALSDRIYRLRYVIPKEYSNPIAKKPEKNYTLQESKTVFEEGTIIDVKSNRNPKIIAGIATDPSNQFKVNVTSEIPHKLSVGDRVRIKNVRSSTNTTGISTGGYNGLYVVTGTPTSKTFSYTNENVGGSFAGITTVARDTSDSSFNLIDLPAFERNEYDTSYTIHDVETIQDYISDQQDGIYYLTCLIGNISPTVSEFSDLKYKQNFTYLYPTVDKDNPNNDPEQTVSAASNKLLGKVDVNNPLYSITKESVINYLRDNRIGFAVTTGLSGSTGITTITGDIEHDLNSINNLLISAAGSGYNGGSAGVVYNVPLTGIGITGGSATANVTVGSGGTVTAVEIVDGGSAYGVGNTMSITGGTGGVVEVTGVNESVGNVIQVIGVGAVGNRNSSAYNGLFKVTDVPSTKSVTYTHVAQGQTTGSNVGIFTGPVGVTTGIFVLLDKAVGITSIVGVANTSVSGIVTVTTSSGHGLAVGNKIKIAGLVGTAATVYNGYDFIVNERVGLTTFTMKSPIGIGTVSESGAELYKYSLNSFGQDTSLASEKISGSLTPLVTGVSLTMDSAITNTATTLSVANFTGISTGDFLQVDNELMRVKAKSTSNTSDLTVIRGVLGTRSVAHDSSTLVRGVEVIPSQTNRFSTIRASGHTFEYIGYGPGNYSTSLPQKIVRTLEEEEELLAISREEKGGVVFFSGMNDRGDFFSGERVQARELFLGETSDDALSVSFDDVYIRNTLRVGGGPNRNLPSEFNGPLNVTNKLTSTSLDGIEALKLLIKGNAINKPFFQVGDDTSPSLVVNKDTQNVGIQTATPAYELDVNGTIRANAYENFKLSDLPDSTEETTYARNRIIKVNQAGNGYEMIDPHELSAYELRSLGISNDPSIYVGLGAAVGGKLQISGISTARFFIDERVKLFGVTRTTDSATVPAPIVGNTVKVASVPTTGFSTSATYYYWQAQYNMKNGKIGISSQIDPTGAYTGTGARAGVANTIMSNFNDLNHNTLTLSRTNSDHGILIYRQNFTGVGTVGNADLGQAKLIAVLGQKELSSAGTTELVWKDYGVYEQTAWSAKGNVNEFIGFHTSTVETNQIHFPTIGTEGQRRGWDIDKVVAIGQNSITVEGNYNLNTSVGFGTTAHVKVVHDNTQAISEAISATVSAGGNYLNLPSGTYLTNRIIVPTKFTLRGSGKNSIIKQQYYANDTRSIGSAGTALYALPFDGNLVGIGTTNPTDVTMQDVTVDGNSSNNLRFESDLDNNLLTFTGGTSMLFKDVEIRNAPGGGLYARNSKRISIENCAIVDGGQTDRYNFRPLDVQNSETVRINDSLFENYPGPLDLSVTSVVSTGGNIIRNCGSGLDAYATGKITTTNNIILGPADEFLASPDIYDSDFDSVNITIDTSEDPYTGPTLLYVEEGNGKDLSSSKVTITAGIGTMVGLYSTTRIATLGTKFIETPTLSIMTEDSRSDGYGRNNGYVQLKLSLGTTSLTSDGDTVLDRLVGSATSALGYEILGEEYTQQPSGFTTFIGISTGYWANNDTYVAPNVGSAVTQYIVKLENPGQLSGISVGDVVKLPEHSFAPNLSSGLTVGMKDSNNQTITTATGLTVQKTIDVDVLTKLVVLTGFSTTAALLQHGSTVVPDDYISIRRKFTIAKGRVGVI